MPVVAAGDPALLRCILLERGSYAVSASLWIGAEHCQGTLGTAQWRP
jgi:hypothetical protein